MKNKLLCAGMAAGILTASPVVAGGMTLTSPDLTDNGVMKMEQVFNGFGCTGGNISPALSWSGAPADTKYFAMTVYDPDAPTGSGWWHWIVVNIPASVSAIPHGGPVPNDATEVMNDFDQTGYGGACPPTGNAPHRYQFTVYALKDKVPVQPSTSGAMAGYYIQSLKLDEARITVTYGR